MKRNYNIFFIALDSEKDKISEMEAWLQLTHLEYERVTGVVVENYSSVKNYDRETRLKKYGYDFLKSEIGCFLAHRKCWEKITKTNVPSLIMESDVFLSNTELLKKILDDIVKTDTSDIVRLSGIFENNEIFKRIVYKGTNGTEIYQTLGDPVGAAAYFIFPNAAKILLKFSESFFDPVDIFLGSVWIHKLRYRTVKPYPLSIRGPQNQNTDMKKTTLDSSIGDRIKPKQSYQKRLKIEAFRFKNDLKKILYLPFNFFKK